MPIVISKPFKVNNKGKRAMTFVFRDTYLVEMTPKRSERRDVTAENILLENIASSAELKAFDNATNKFITVSADCNAFMSPSAGISPYDEITTLSNRITANNVDIAAHTNTLNNYNNYQSLISSLNSDTSSNIQAQISGLPAIDTVVDNMFSNLLSTIGVSTSSLNSEISDTVSNIVSFNNSINDWYNDSLSDPTPVSTLINDLLNSTLASSPHSNLISAMNNLLTLPDDAAISGQLILLMSSFNSDFNALSSGISLADSNDSSTVDSSLSDIESSITSINNSTNLANGFVFELAETRDVINNTKSSIESQTQNTVNNALTHVNQQIDIYQNQIIPAKESDNQNSQNRINYLSERIETCSGRKNEASAEQRNAAILLLKKMADLSNQNDGVNVDISSITGKYLLMLQAASDNPSLNLDVNPVTFFYNETKNPLSLTDKITSKTNDLARRIDRFKNTIENRNTDIAGQIRKQLDQYGVFDPAVCGLTAIDNEGNILPDRRYDIPFQFISDVKEGKTASYNETTPMGRFEPIGQYSNSGPFTISLDLGYMAFDSGAGTDESFIQEMKDRYLAATYPLYSKNTRTGEKGYGAPYKYLLNMFKRFVNVPVRLDDVQFENQGGWDVYTWFHMGFKINITLKTSFRLAQVISSDDVINYGNRALIHKRF